MAILSVLALAIFMLLMGNMIMNTGLFISALLLGSLGLSSVLTMIAAIASRASNNFSLMAILSFPIVLPLLMTLMKVSASALSGNSWSGTLPLLVILLVINIAVILLAVLLFPYLWRD
jgi:heme exporter protein B